MFDLNEVIATWRSALKAQPNFRVSDLDELEDHLREAITELEGAGLSQEEAFVIASRRLGKPEDLSGEFAIADPERRRTFRLSWMITGALALLFLMLAVEVLTNIGTGTLSRLDLAWSPLGIGWVGGVLRLGLLVLGGLLIWRLLATDRSAHRLRRMRGVGVVAAAFVLAGMALATRFGSQHFLFSGMEHGSLVTVASVGAWFQLIVLLVLPVLLLVGLWRIIRS